MKNTSRHFRIRPSRGISLFGGLFGLLFIGIGLFVVIPQFGTFGVIWTVVAVGITVAHLYNGLSKRGFSTEIAEVSNDAIAPTDDIEERLSQLDHLYQKGSISSAEHQKQRSKIIESI